MSQRKLKRYPSGSCRLSSAWPRDSPYVVGFRLLATQSSQQIRHRMERPDHALALPSMLRCVLVHSFLNFIGIESPFLSKLPERANRHAALVLGPVDHRPGTSRVREQPVFEFVCR